MTRIPFSSIKPTTIPTLLFARSTRSSRILLISSSVIPVCATITRAGGNIMGINSGMIPTKLAIFLIVILLRSSRFRGTRIVLAETAIVPPPCIRQLSPHCQVDGAKDSFRHPNNEDGQREGAPGDDTGERKDCGHQQPFHVVACSSYVSEPEECPESASDNQIAGPNYPSPNAINGLQGPA